MKIKEVILFSLLCVCFTSQAQKYQLISPDKKLQLDFNIESGRLTYSVAKESTLLLNPTSISVTLDGVIFPNESVKASATAPMQVKNTVRPEVRLKTEEFEEKYNELVITFTPQVALRARVYNDAVAYRWESNAKKDTVIVDDEIYNIDFANKSLSRWNPSPNGDGFFSHQECNYVYKSNMKGGSFSVPVLSELPANDLLLVTDVNTQNYPGLWMEANGGIFQTNFPRYPKKLYLHGDRSMTVEERETFVAKIPGTYTFPWRAMMITSGAGLLSSNTLYSLADPSKIGDASWIVPGKATWEWWNKYQIEDVPFTPGINQDTYKHYIDFASENGLPYLLIDDGWATKQFPTVVSTLNMPELIAYAKEKGVKVILWTSSVALEANFDEAFDLFQKWGVAGIKMDFMQRDDQIMNNFCYRVAEEAAKRKMIVDLHGGPKPTGLHRTYPNVLSHESVFGMEQSLWNTKANPNMAIMNAFIRMSVGPMDYTPGAMINMTRENFVPAKTINYAQMGSMSTRCQQLAMYVVYTSPVQMLCDSPTRYRKNPTAMDFLKEVPTVWDETVVLEAVPCTHLAVARRSGNKWFVGCMTNEKGRDLTLDMSFLPKGIKYKMKSWRDGANANVDAQDNVVETTSIDCNSKVKVTMANGGGYAAIIEIDSNVSSLNMNRNDSGMTMSHKDNNVLIFDISGKLIEEHATASSVDISKYRGGCYLQKTGQNSVKKIGM